MYEKFTREYKKIIPSPPLLSNEKSSPNGLDACFVSMVRGDGELKWNMLKSPYQLKSRVQILIN